VTPVNTAVNHPSRRLIVHLPHPYDEARELYEILVPRWTWPDSAKWQLASHSGARRNQCPTRVHALLPQRCDRGHGGVSVVLEGNQYLMGNHTIAERMFHHDPAVMLHAPLRTVIYADPDGDTKLAVDQPSLLFHSYESPDVAKVGCRLDYLISLLIINMGGDLPSELRHTS